VYLALGTALAAVLVSARPVGLADALALVFWGFPPALVILGLASPVVLARPRVVTRWLRPQEPVGFRRDSRLAPLPPVVVRERTILEFPSEEARLVATPAQRAFVPRPAHPTPPEEPSAHLVADPALREPERTAGGPIDSDPVVVDGEMPIRIPFARIASQVPADAFVLPLDRLSASLREPHHLTIPLRLILPQLAEGSVEIAWALVEAQFPELAYAEERPEFEDRFPNLRLTLPIDEIVRQLPPAIFRVAAPATDLHAIESFPPPFQPFVTTMEVGATVAGELERFLDRARDEAPPAPEAGPEAGDPGGDTPARVDDPVVAPAAEAPPPARAPEPLEAARTPAREIAACLAPAGAFGVAAHRLGGRLVLAFLTPDVDPDGVLRVVERVAPLVATEDAETATLRGPGTALVLSACRLADEEALVLAAVRPGAPLALLERLMLRATSAWRRPGAPATPSTVSLNPGDPDAARRLAELGRGPEGFGRVVPAAFVDTASGLEVYVFHARGAEARALGGLASRAHAALAGAEGNAFGPLTLRQGEGRTVVRPLGGGRPRPGVVAAAGPVTLAGLAGREVERVALALEAA
jgi:hypothetical protein